ncbi:hypothetical protein RUM43_013513 [Polyplax serrata]|uniref:Uncharacterized protein n=1 Tax=Polyplax serrata TaxID=468196 RepID=A0AAN8S9N4_POLSC
MQFNLTTRTNSPMCLDRTHKRFRERMTTNNKLSEFKNKCELTEKETTERRKTADMGLDEGHKDDATKELRGGRQIDTHRPETDRRLTKSNKVVQMVFHAAFTATLTKKLKQKDKTGNCVPPRPVRTNRGSRHIRHLSDNEKQLPRTQKRTAEVGK